MTDDRQPHAPQPPAGMRRPGVPGAGNLLDPAVRGELREQVHDAAKSTGQQLRAGAAQQPAAPAEQAAAEPATPQQAEVRPQHRAGPFAHGDVDLKDLVPNVLPNVRPRRGRSERRFYFIKQTEEPAAPAPGQATPAAGPKPG